MKVREDVSKEYINNIGLTSFQIILTFQQENERRFHDGLMYHEISSKKT